MAKVFEISQTILSLADQMKELEDAVDPDAVAIEQKKAEV